MNQADSDILSALILDNASYELTQDEDESEVVVLNTCTVKGATENKIIEQIKRLQLIGKKIVVAGCLTANKDKIRKFAPNASIIGTSSLQFICNAIDDAIAGRATEYLRNHPKDQLPKILQVPIMRIPINEGCISSCNFCQTKLARPFLSSYSPKTIVKWINKSVANGAREIQLTSMDTGAYGLDIKTNLIELLDLIINDDSSTKIDKEFFIRIGMLNPAHVKKMLPDIIRILKDKHFYKFIHIPVQTGSEKVCREMNRDHTVKDFIDIVDALRKSIPEIMISTDIIVGYPTETKKDFKETLNLLRKTNPDIINLSKFSARPGTKAKELKQLHNDEIKKRSTEATELVKKITEERKKRYVGKEYRVYIMEDDPDPKGRNINYQQVVVKNFKGELGDFVEVKIVDANHGSLFGEPLHK